MSKGVILSVAVLVFAACISGCATTAKKTEVKETGEETQLQSQVTQLKNEVASLGGQIVSQTQELNNLKEQLKNVEKEKEALSAKLAKKNIIGEAEIRPNVEQIKVALINAGYQPGPINMKIQRETFNAIRAFQKANKLTPDGMVGKKTWAVLKEYLYGQPE
ncbi:MAG: peptidoglycan-binding protein [Candidatus Omnitrophota bacterium]